MEKILTELDVDACAKRLLGAVIVRDLDGKQLRLKIVETESYDQQDQASHSYKRTPRSEPMYGPAGRAYVYFIYGNHHCFNVVCGPEGLGAGVLIRAAEPLNEHRFLRGKRGVDNLADSTNGPGKLCQALGIDKRFIGHDLTRPPLKVQLQPPLTEASIVRTKRVGISKAVHERRRFYIKDSRFVSKP